jgi:predicted N-acetyltransferase YhbS
MAELLPVRDSVIRPGRVDEARALSDLALRSKASWGYSSELVASFREELTLSEHDIERVLVVEVEGKVVGFYSLQPLSASRVELGHLFVEPALRRRGLGQLMIADALRRAGTQGFSALEIQGDPNAEPFYTRVGATRIGERESDSVQGRMLPLFEIVICG